MSFAGIKSVRSKYKSLRSGQKAVVWLFGALFLYVLDAWLLGSLALYPAGLDLVRRCLRNPLLAAVLVPLRASVPAWLVLNAFVFLLILYGWYSLYTHSPELMRGLFPKREPEVLGDPTCGTSRWMTRDEAEKVFSFGHGPGIWLGSLDGEIVRHDNPRLNRNCIVFGPPQSGKTWSFILPNLLQSAVSGDSVIATDPKGEILKETISLFQKEGYVVRSFNLVDMNLSDRWNPIDEVRTELDAHLLTEIIIVNTDAPTHRPGGDKFWERSEHNLLNALVLYAVHEMRREERSLAGIYDFLTCGSFDELDSTFKSLPDDHPAKRPYNLFSMAEPKTRGNIITGLGTRLKVFQSRDVRNLTSKSEIDLELPGRRKCIYYCVIPDGDNPFRFLSSLFFSFLFLRLTRQGDRFGGKNPVRINFIMDEFCTIGTIPNFKDMIATMRGRNISCMMVAQSLPQLENRYPNKVWQEIIGCCSLMLVWGAAEKETAEYISHLLGTATVEQLQYRKTIGAWDHVHETTSPKGRPLMDPSEVRRLPPDEGIVLPTGYDPLRLKKLSYREHPLAGALEPVKKYVPLRERQVEKKDIAVEDGSDAEESFVEGWEGFVS